MRTILNNYIGYAPETIIIPGCFVMYGLIMRWKSMQALGWMTLLAMLMFYRGARLNPAATPSNALICPCDGKILGLREVGEMMHIAIFLNVHNIHVQYAPIDGRIKDQKYHAGEFHPAYMFEKSQYNERLETTLATAIGDVKVIQIAGLVARRIVPFHKIGARLKKGDPLGLIKFGSRVDIWLPKHKIETMDVRTGDRVRIGDTLLTFGHF